MPVSCLDAISKNVVLAGGFWRIKGMQKYFKSNVVSLLDQFPRLNNLDIKSKLGKYVDLCRFCILEFQSM